MTPWQHTLDFRAVTGDDTHQDPGLVLIKQPSRKPSKITLLASSFHMEWLSQPAAISKTHDFVQFMGFSPLLYVLFLISCAKKQKTKEKQSASSTDCREVRREQLQSPCYCQDCSGVLLISVKGGRGVRGTVIVSTELKWEMKGWDGETAGESDKYDGFIVMRYISMLEKQKGWTLYEWRQEAWCAIL